MADVTVRHIDELESWEDQGRFMFARRGLGVTSFGMNVGRYPSGYDAYPEHDHIKDGQEEVYFVVDGSMTLEAGGEAHELTSGTFARVGPDVKRKIVPGPDGVTVLALGGTPGTFESRA